MDLHDYLDIEVALHSRLIGAWTHYAAEHHAAMMEAVQARDFATAYGIAQRLEMLDALAPLESDIFSLLKMAAIFGSRVAGDGESSLLASLNFPSIMNASMSTFMEGVEYNITHVIQDAALQSIALAERGALQRVYKAEADVFIDFLTAGNEALKVQASLFTNRLSSWGFMTDMDIRGRKTYRLTAKLDSRTSRFCQIVHGKLFRVEDGLFFINILMHAQSVNDQKTLHPWPRQDKDSIDSYEKMNAAALTQLGLHLPPYHPHCRTICVPANRSSRLT